MGWNDGRSVLHIPLRMISCFKWFGKVFANSRPHPRRKDSTLSIDVLSVSSDWNGFRVSAWLYACTNGCLCQYMYSERSPNIVDILPVVLAEVYFVIYVEYSPSIKQTLIEIPAIIFDILTVWNEIKILYKQIVCVHKAFVNYRQRIAVLVIC